METDPHADSAVDETAEIDPDLGPNAGETTQVGRVTQRPPAAEPPAPPAPAAPTWTQVALDTWALPTPTVEPLPAVEFPLEPISGGGLASNQFGCSARCVTTALLQSNHVNSDVELSMTTNVDTQKWVWLLPAGPYLVNGVPAFLSNAPVATAPTATRGWSTTLTGLAPDTAYRVVIGVRDSQGNNEHVTTQFTTTAIADQLVGNGTGCYYQCITSATAKSTLTHTVVELTAATNTDAAIEFAVSTSAPGTIAGHPFLPNDVTLTSVSEGPRSREVRAIDLLPDTTYYVVVKVTDDLGQSQWATGSFRSDPALPPPPAVPEPTDVFVAFERAHVHNDGDRLSKGEVGWAWRIDTAPAYTGSRSTATIDDGESLTFAWKTGTWVTVRPGGTVPSINLTAWEEDGIFEHCDTVPRAEPYESELCNWTYNPAISPEFSIDNINGMTRCSNWGIEGATADEACMVMSSAYVNDDFVQFDVLISFDIAD